MASAITVTTKRNDSVSVQEQTKPTVPLTQAKQATRQPNQQLKRPYLKLLMPEPPPDQANDKEERKADCRFMLYVLSHGRRNRDWKSHSVFDESDDEDDEPLSPLPSEGEPRSYAKADCTGTVVIDGEEMVDMIG